MVMADALGSHLAKWICPLPLEYTAAARLLLQLLSSGQPRLLFPGISKADSHTYAPR
jgi:hypothetical protein